jgi:two-component system, cell cycle sensor histidine kinase DivJ
MAYENCRLRRFVLQGGKDIEVRVDRDALAMILRKTIFNGIKFCLSGGTVTVEAWKTARFVLVSVSDSGVGLRPEKVQSVLADTGEESRSNLGLSMCRRILEASNGHLDIISEPGMGTTVSLSLPS